MSGQLNREIKAYCPDFVPVRQLLKDSGATFVEVKEQVDYYFQLPTPEGDEGTPRLKLRVEGENKTLIYYRDFQKVESRVSEFQLWPAPDPQFVNVLETALGVRAIVRKQREIWQRDNIRYNLDTVDDVGQILEVEVQAGDRRDIAAQLEENRRKLASHLGPRITSSNQDLVRALRRKEVDDT